MKKDASLTPAILDIVRHQATEAPGTGAYNQTEESGTYLCRACGAPLFFSNSKFHSGCGWPSFDEGMLKSVKEKPDADGYRTEIVCAHCDAHLGHVFRGEGFTEKNARHCVNSASIDFVPHKQTSETEEAIVAGGCFWGVEYLLQQLPGVLKTEVGYTGGAGMAPSYHDVCNGNTGHVEAVRIVFDPTQISYEKLLRYFFEIHDPTQADGQGPDKGAQYLSVIFYYDESQKKVALTLIHQLEQKGLHVATILKPAQVFWRAEDNHQQYYAKNREHPYCHHYVKRFV